MFDLTLSLLALEFHSLAGTYIHSLHELLLAVHTLELDVGILRSSLVILFVFLTHLVQFLGLFL